jgi:hypothetical protein
MYQGQFPQGLYNEIEEFQISVQNIREHSEEIEGTANTISETDVDNLARKFASLYEELEVLSGKVQKAKEQMESSIIPKWRGL